MRCLIFASCMTNTSQKTAFSMPPSLLAASHRAFSDNHVVLFDHATDMYCGAANERVVFNLFVEGALSFDMKRAGYQPFDVIGQA